METLMKVETWLPMFSGFYGTIWETDSDEEMEIENINEQRKEKELKPITWDDIEWNYLEYQNSVVKGVTSAVGTELEKLGLIKECKLQKLVSPREYNFANDSINVAVILTKTNVKKIQAYLNEHKEAFSTYIQEKYTSRSGFISFHSNHVDDWISPDVLGGVLADGHKLGSILNFILENEDKEIEMTIYEDLHGNGTYLTAANYSDLMEKEVTV